MSPSISTTTVGLIPAIFHSLPLSFSTVHVLKPLAPKPSGENSANIAQYPVLQSSLRESYSQEPECRVLLISEESEPWLGFKPILKEPAPQLLLLFCHLAFCDYPPPLDHTRDLGGDFHQLESRGRGRFWEAAMGRGTEARMRKIRVGESFQFLFAHCPKEGRA